MCFVSQICSLEGILFHKCVLPKVFSASSVEIVTRSRTEHLSAADKERTAAQRSPLHSFFVMAEEVTQHQPHKPQVTKRSTSPTNPR